MIYFASGCTRRR